MSYVTLKTLDQVLMEEAGPEERSFLRRAKEEKARWRTIFLSLISTAPRAELTVFDRWAEEADLSWRIKVLTDRLNTIYPAASREWQPADRDHLESLQARLDTLSDEHSPDRIRTMDEDRLASVLLALEAHIRDLRRLVRVAHEVRTERDKRMQRQFGCPDCEGRRCRHCGRKPRWNRETDHG